mmetsp:Transcript_35983/g.111800  ORF Transcript_35983/g.111800 Transcript_35983/m.111800 type:complete len:430 (-) Transcript_35983:753-2042(-)
MCLRLVALLRQTSAQGVVALGVEPICLLLLGHERLHLSLLLLHRLLLPLDDALQGLPLGAPRRHELAVPLQLPAQRGGEPRAQGAFVVVARDHLPGIKEGPGRPALLLLELLRRLGPGPSGRSPIDAPHAAWPERGSSPGGGRPRGCRRGRGGGGPRGHGRACRGRPRPRRHRPEDVRRSGRGGHFGRACGGAPPASAARGFFGGLGPGRHGPNTGVVCPSAPRRRPPHAEVRPRLRPLTPAASWPARSGGRTRRRAGCGLHPGNLVLDLVAGLALVVLDVDALLHVRHRLGRGLRLAERGAGPPRWELVSLVHRGFFARLNGWHVGSRHGLRHRLRREGRHRDGCRSGSVVCIVRGKPSHGVAGVLEARGHGLPQVDHVSGAFREGPGSVSGRSRGTHDGRRCGGAGALRVEADGGRHAVLLRQALQE